MKVEVYFNLHKQLFSVRSCKIGRVIAHTTHVHLDSPVFIVRQSGRKRVLREGKKNVHAFVRGETAYFTDFDPDYLDYTLVAYNPYKFDTFVDVIDTRPVRTAKRAVLQLQPSIVVGDRKNKPYLYDNP